MEKGLGNTDEIGRVTVGVGGGVDKVSIREAAALLGVHPNTVRHRVKSGVYRAEKVTTKHGPTWLIDRASLGSNTSVREPERLAESHHTEPAQGTSQAQNSEEYESSVKPRWRRWVFAPFRLLAWPFVALYKWLSGEAKSAKFAVRISEVTALIALFVAALSWLLGAPQRQLESELEAWRVIDAARGAQTSSARFYALQFLDDAGASLNGLALSNAKLAGIELANADMRHVDLSNADLVGADLAGADLRDADLRGANLSGADLSGAALSGANLTRKTNLDEASLRGCDLRGVNLRGVDLSFANLRETDLSDVDLSETGLAGTDLKGADLSGVNLRDVDDLRFNNFSEVNLRDANLRGTDLTFAVLIGTDLRGADLRGADFTGAILRGADLSGADLSGAKDITTKELEQQAKSVEGATMPDGSKHP